MDIKWNTCMCWSYKGAKRSEEMKKWWRRGPSKETMVHVMMVIVMVMMSCDYDDDEEEDEEQEQE